MPSSDFAPPPRKPQYPSVGATSCRELVACGVGLERMQACTEHRASVADGSARSSGAPGAAMKHLRRTQRLRQAMPEAKAAKLTHRPA